MPFQSEKQRRYLWANEPKIARDWADTYGSRIEKNDGGIMNPRLVPHTGADLLVKNTATGERPKYQPPGGGATSLGSGRDAPGSNRQPGHSVSNTRTHTRTHTPSGDGPGNIHGGTTVKEALKVGKEKKELRDLAKRTAEDKREERVEVFRSKKKKNLLDHLPYIGTLKKMFNHRDFFIDQVLNKGHYGDTLTEEAFYDMSPVEQEKALKDYNRARGMGEIDAYGREVDLSNRGEGQARELRKLASAGQGGGGGGGATAATTTTPSAFQTSLTGTADTPDYYVGSNPLASNIAWGKQAGVDPRTMGVYNQDQLGFPTWAAEGGRIPAAFGGIMDSSTGRRAYGLGSIFKKIGRAAKKVFKSPIGRAALIGGLGAWGMGMGPFAGKAGSGWLSGALSQAGSPNQKAGWLRNIFSGGKGFEGGLNPWKIGIGAASMLPFFMGDKEEDEGSKFDYEGAKNKYADEIMRLRRGVMAGNLKDAATQSFLPVNYREGGRIGYYAGGQSTPSDYTMEDARMMTTQDKLGGITDVMKQADLHRQGSVGQMYAAHGGRIGAEEGGLMDLGGMEKDYRNDGGFVPLGGEEKADDVPARLSKNEFVFTADAVRGAGDGDIDKGAEIMENIMKNLEQGGQISEETQGLSGAQEMFGVSERLSEVV